MSSNNSTNKSRALRLSDVFGEPGKMLTPIQGFEGMPIVSLEEAVKPLVSVVPDVKRMAYVAKEKCLNPPPDGLTLDESASIMIYTMEWYPHEQSLYYMLNGTLRRENREELKPWFLYLKLVFTALNNIPSLHVSVYRGVNAGAGDAYKTGRTIIWWGFSSCTASIEVLENEIFLQKQGERTMFHIECDSAKDIRRHSQFNKEDEILLLPGRQFQIVGRLRNSDGLATIQLKEVKPPFPLLNIPGQQLKNEPIQKVSKPSASKPQSKSVQNVTQPQKAEKHFVCRSSECRNRCKRNHGSHYIACLDADRAKCYNKIGICNNCCCCGLRCLKCCPIAVFLIFCCPCASAYLYRKAKKSPSCCRTCSECGRKFTCRSIYECAKCKNLYCYDCCFQ